MLRALRNLQCLLRSDKPAQNETAPVRGTEAVTSYDAGSEFVRTRPPVNTLGWEAARAHRIHVLGTGSG